MSLGHTDLSARDATVVAAPSHLIAWVRANQPASSHDEVWSYHLDGRRRLRCATYLGWRLEDVAKLDDCAESQRGCRTTSAVVVVSRPWQEASIDDADWRAITRLGRSMQLAHLTLTDVIVLGQHGRRGRSPAWVSAADQQQWEQVA